MAVNRSGSVTFASKQIHVHEEEGTLYLEQEGQRTKLAPPRRALPLSLPDEWIMLSSSEGLELGLIRRLSDLDPTSRDALRSALADAYHITTILRVLEVERETIGGQIIWRVITQLDENETDDSGSGREVTFRLAGAEDVQTARYPHIYFSDIDGNRFEIPNCEAMDLASRRASERYF